MRLTNLLLPKTQGAGSYRPHFTYEETEALGRQRSLPKVTQLVSRRALIYTGSHAPDPPPMLMNRLVPFFLQI